MFIADTLTLYCKRKIIDFRVYSKTSFQVAMLLYLMIQTDISDYKLSVKIHNICEINCSTLYVMSTEHTIDKGRPLRNKILPKAEGNLFGLKRQIWRPFLDLLASLNPIPGPFFSPLHNLAALFEGCPVTLNQVYRLFTVKTKSKQKTTSNGRQRCADFSVKCHIHDTLLYNILVQILFFFCLPMIRYLPFELHP